MAALHNRISQKELKQRLLAETEPRTTISFYHYFPVADPKAFRDELFLHLDKLNVFGRIYVAHEGINAQISVPMSNFEAFKNYLYSISPLNGIRLNIAVDDDGKSFWVLKIKVRDKIVADGIEDPGFDMENRGKYVNAEAFNRLTENPETIVVDMRNHYEYEVGHFESAIEVPSDTFREQLPMAADMLKDAKEKNIIMYCTGGIRCEKASAYMLHKGFKNVFHLEGGIINYVNQAKENGLPLKFRGKNFVFDNRLGERVTEEVISKCHQCGTPADTHVNCANEGCHLLFIQCEECKTKWEGTCGPECFDFIHLPLEEQKEKRKGVDKGRNVFNKSRARLRPKLSELQKTEQGQ
ncbi:rhodanese-related sulfurtransferase [Flavisolibacter ginsenosidimutans]|uniref:tRNA uridine(34) hydroxylase n=1 Tax=Flavisolibacter ginsenosidimutans TaxID=661481 RepID=A0A5B8UEZ1_9BACT|nr:rhodanese-related sulfurtransferase [Flavisolibacter ginsenosidimutans]QEC55043.1 rhodanese-related sulfurtransferase [Flavisolibacter ginsenosidimutans]